MPKTLVTSLLIAAASILHAVSLEGAAAQNAGAEAAVQFQTDYYAIELAPDAPQFVRFQVDSLGDRRWLRPNILKNAPEGVKSNWNVQRNGGVVDFEPADTATPAAAPVQFTFRDKGFSVRIDAPQTGDRRMEVLIPFDLRSSFATLLGRIDEDGAMPLPTVLHIPSQGTFRITSESETPPLGYESKRGLGRGKDFVYVRLRGPKAGEDPVTYHFEVVSIYPKVPGIEGDPRFDGYRRCWLNMFQLNPQFRALANHAASDVVAFVVYEYAEMAAHTPPIAKGVTMMDIVGDTLDRYLNGMLAYGMPGYRMGAYPKPSLDTYPSLVYAASIYYRETGDKEWLAKHYDKIREWAEIILNDDTDGDGLIEYWRSGNRNSYEKREVRPANWWDTICFGHKDAYCNALAYRALGSVAKTAEAAGREEDAKRYAEAARTLKKAYYPTFYNPKSGLLAGWKSADGELHDYWFTFVNGIAVAYDLVSDEQGNRIMDSLFEKFEKVGYDRFDLGLPGNLLPVPASDNWARAPRFGMATTEDDTSNFQKYENGGATACWAYYTIAGLYKLGREKDGDRILMPMLGSFDDGEFSGFGDNDMSNDWRAWDGTPWGYEGLLVDGYKTLLSVPVRQGVVEP